jgi:hypothetical protein
MSLIDSASLIVTPNGYKEGKLYSVIPSDGSGDMSVVRATTATRVNSAGLVELVPYNLLTYSQQFDNADWTKASATITANTTTAPDGTTTADTLTITSGGYLLQQLTLYPAVSGQSVTISVYAKNQTTNFLIFGGATPSGTDTSTITNVGNGWYRHTTTRVFTTTTSAFPLQWIIYDQVGTHIIWGAQLVEGSTAKDYQKTETRLNIPRLDYSNGTCPSLLVEPQRTNQYIKSNDFYNWSNNNGTNTITPNYAISPDGIMNASRWVATGTGYRYNLYGLFTLGTTTVSIYAKRNNSGTQKFGFFLNGSGTVDYELNLTNEWQRFTYTFNLTNEYQGLSAEVGADVSIYGYQLEVGSYATSYIPTTSASVTRNADVISKTGISSLIGQTEGTLFVDVDFTHTNKGSNEYLAQIWSSNVTRILLYRSSVSGQIGVIIIQSSSTIYSFLSTVNTNERHKVAFAYKSGDIAFYIDGSSVSTSSSSFSPFSSLQNYDLGIHTASGTPIEIGDYSYNASALWKTRLTNDELERLTGTGFNTYAEMANYYNYITQ